MFVFYRKNKETGEVKKYLSWGFHELAFSLRTSGFPMWVLDNKGELLKKLSTVKSAGNTEIPKTARYLVKYYRTNGGYEDYTIYNIPNKNFEELKVISVVEKVIDLKKANIPEEVKDFVLEQLVEGSIW